ncbi:hypothetical protein GCM10010191_02260 [Actinomadura vinacea]|uniref:DUF4132 domain-containing protein n=2 Tax=Actinomadura vinacea TaxID=115336 RepID=A0ABN3IC28_9ACTN
MPEDWRAILHPRHGGTPGPPIELDPEAAAAARSLAEEAHDAIVFLLKAEKTPIDMIESTRAHLNGEADPQGAAVVAAVVAAETELMDDIFAAIDRARGLGLFADAWISEHGLTFAAAATAELSRVFVRGYEYQKKHSWCHLSVRRPGEEERGSGRIEYCLDLVSSRVRAFLAAAGERDYLEAVEALADRRRDKAQRITTAYLAPTRLKWVDEACAELDRDTGDRDRLDVLRSLGSFEQFELLRERYLLILTGDPLYTMVDGVGPALAPAVARAIDVSGYDTEVQARVLAALPTDEAFDLLVARLHRPHVHAAVVEAARRFPARALRLLAATVGKDPAAASYAARLLRTHISTHPELTAALLPSLPADARHAVEAIDEHAKEWPAEVPPQALPRLLVEPPWTRDRAEVKPVTVRGLKAPDEPVIAWAPGEREKWAATTEPGRPPEQDPHWDKAIQKFRASPMDAAEKVNLLTGGPEDRVRPLLAGWRPTHTHHTDSAWLKPIVARFGLDALPAALDFAYRPAMAVRVLLPFCNAEVAALMAESLVRRPRLRPTVEEWLRRHAFAASRELVPAALGKAGPQRREAEAALRFLASDGHRDKVVDAARDHKKKAAEAIETLLDRDPLDDLPADMPQIDRWVDPHLLPQVLLRGTGQALSGEAARHIITMLLLSKPDHPYPGVHQVKEICDPASLAAFAWALFEGSGLRGQSGGAGDEAWVLTALGLLGDDETVRALTPIIRAWPGDGSHHKAVAGLDVLVAIGTDVALMHLNGIARSVKYKGIRAKAQERITALAAELGLSPERLGDRLVPDLGLDADGGLTLDYGPRRFTVGFDERLKPYVMDENGARRTALPKPGARDDQELAPAAHKRFAALKKDVRTVAADQILRLEQAMVTRRRWTSAEFHGLIVSHPLLWHIARRLVWITGEGRAFRIAEDRTLADVDDTGLELAAEDRVGVAHPLDLSGKLDAWDEVLADYELMQPFQQLRRPVHALTDSERAGTALERFANVSVPSVKVLGMERRGWQRGTAEDNGIQSWITREVPGGTVVIDLDPGITVGDPTYWPEQTITRVWLSDGTRLSWRIDRSPLPFSALAPVTASEILNDLSTLTTP